MRYQRLQDIVRLAARFQGTLGGLILGEIEADFAISRRTAERLRDAVDAVFGPLELVDNADTKRHWRLRSDAGRGGLGRHTAALSELVNERTGVSVDMAIRLSKAFGSTPETWLGMQMAYDLWQARERARQIEVERFAAA